MFENDDMDLYAETFHPTDTSLVKFKREWIKAELKVTKINIESRALNLNRELQNLSIAQEQLVLCYCIAVQ